MSEEERREVESQEHSRRRKKTKEQGRQWIYRLLIAVFLLLFLFSGMQVVKILRSYQEAVDFYNAAASTYTSVGMGLLPGEGSEDEGIQPPISVDFQSLVEINEDIYGWIYMEDTVVNYPLLQGTNNFYYLDKTYERRYLASGSIYLDSDNDRDMNDSHSVVFGHNMKNHTMFGDLDQFLKADYLQAHPYVDLMLVDGSWKRYKIYSMYRAGVEDGTYDVPLNDEEKFSQFIELTLSKNTYAAEAEAMDLPQPTTEDRILTLSTCTEDSSNTERFVIHAVEIDPEEEAAKAAA